MTTFDSAHFENLLQSRYKSCLTNINKAFGDLQKHGCSESLFREFEAHILQLLGPAQASHKSDISSALKQLYQELRTIKVAVLPPLSSQLKHMQQLIEKLAAYASTLEINHEAPKSTHSQRAKVFLVIKDQPFAKEIAQQLSLYGFDSETFLEFSNVLQNYSPQSPIAACIIESDALSDDPLLTKWPEGTPAAIQQIPMLYLSDHDDLDIRLQCVHAGGQAFFTKPLEMASVLEKLELFSGSSSDSAEPYRVLIVEDSEPDALFAKTALEQAGMITEVLDQALLINKTLIEFRPDLILMDIYMPHCSGIDLAKVIRQQDAFVGLPIIFLSSEQDIEKQLAALSIGGDDFLSKPIKEDHLVAAIKHRGQRARELRTLMVRDSLTGVLNHTHSLHQLEVEVARAARQNTPLCFAMIDLDHFKEVNDTYGHPVGDRVLKSITQLLRQRLRRTDTIGRYGGEEFAVILPNTTIEAAELLLDSIRQSFANIRHHTDHESFHVTYSCGVAEFISKNLSSAEDLCEAADKAMYAAKKQGRNRVISY